MNQAFNDQFKNPGSEFRGAPFWAWNCKLDSKEMTDQVDYFKEMGLGGFHMHCRTGLDTPYMSDDFLKIIQDVVVKAKKEGMYAWLYDEDRWPSGAAGGLVTKDPAYRARFLVFCPWKQEDRPAQNIVLGSSMGKLGQQGNSDELLARYDVILENGFLKSYRILAEGEEPQGQVWYLYKELAPVSGWFNDQAYLDTLNPKAVQRFIEETHEKYYQAVGDEFGKTVPAIFTDEPQFAHKTVLGFAEEKKACYLPYTDDFCTTYQQQYGKVFLETVPEIFWELPDGKISQARYFFHEHIAGRFAAAFADTLGAWCEKHGIRLTGHMMAESSLTSQTRALGEAMRSYRSFQQPGIDILCDKREFSTAKQTQSALHQYGRSEMTSELYGVTNWDFDFRGHKLQGDWQAALGVTLRVQHLAWASMAGEAKRDYPASIFYQSPWYREYHYIEDHFARVNQALHCGKPVERIGVIHPIESMWLYWGPAEQTAVYKKQLEDHFDDTINWLLLSQLDFDFIAESLLPDLNDGKAEKPFRVGEMAYDVIVVPGCVTLRATTLKRLKAFREAGGQVIFMGEPARYLDACESTAVSEFAKTCQRIDFVHTELINALSPYREVEIKDALGALSDHFVCQLREDEEGRWLFVAQAFNEVNKDVPRIENLTFRIRGAYDAEFYDTMNGTHRVLASEVRDGDTFFRQTMADHDSLLVRLTPVCCAEDSVAVKKANDPDQKEWIEIQRPYGKMKVTLSEPNVYLLDMAEYALDDEEWEEKEEVLRIDNELRHRLGFPVKTEAFAQPWTRSKKPAEHTLALRYTVDSLIEYEGAKLAIETPQECSFSWNGQALSGQVEGWYTDRSIQVIELGKIERGHNTLIVEMPYRTETNVEWAYILGDFGVLAEGSHAIITEPVRELYFGDWTRQGLPFYGGNVTYHTQISGNGKECVLQISKYRAPLLKVSVDGKEPQVLAFAPYQVSLGELEGTHALDLVCYGSRINSFGQLHLCDENVTWFGPMSWRSEKEAWSYEYQLHRCGILSAPILRMEK